MSREPRSIEGPRMMSRRIMVGRERGKTESTRRLIFVVRDDNDNELIPGILEALLPTKAYNHGAAFVERILHAGYCTMRLAQTGGVY